MLVKLNCTLKNKTNIGVVTLDKLPDGSDCLALNGFAGITPDAHVVLRDDGNIITMEIDQEAPLERCIVFNMANCKCQILIDYFNEFDAIGALFVCVGNTYIQCKNIKVTIK